MNNYLLWGACMGFAILNLVFGATAKDELKKDHYITVSATYTAAGFVCLGF